MISLIISCLVSYLDTPCVLLYQLLEYGDHIEVDSTYITWPASLKHIASYMIVIDRRDIE